MRCLFYIYFHWRYENITIYKEEYSVYKICPSLSATADAASAVFLPQLELQHWVNWNFIPVTANKPSWTVQIIVCIKMSFKSFKLWHKV